MFVEYAFKFHCKLINKVKEKLEYLKIEVDEVYMLGSKTLGTKCIRTSLCIMLANHDQNIEFRFRLAQSVFICKIGIE